MSIFENAFSQYRSKESKNCESEFSLFYKYSKVKDYDLAYNHWKWCFENCPSHSVLLYSYGLKIIQYKYGNNRNANYERRIDSIYAQRIKYFPTNLGRVYSNWATSLKKRGATIDIIFNKLNEAYKADPSGMSVKNTAYFFQVVTDRNKTSNVQKVYDTYDTLKEAFNAKIEKLSRVLDQIKIKEQTGKSLSKKELRTKKNNEISLRALSHIEVVLGTIINEGIDSNCEKLLPLYKNSFAANKKNIKWLKRALARLSSKKCKENSTYAKILEAYANNDRSTSGILTYQIYKYRVTRHTRPKLYNCDGPETDPYKKAEYLYKIARTMHGSKARTYARRALKYRPNMGKAYLLIAREYAKSANQCGTDEFSKRMVYVAAANKARKAKEVDPSITATADKYIKSYTASFPSKRTCIGYKNKEFYVKCWIGETVKIP